MIPFFFFCRSWKGQNQGNGVVDAAHATRGIAEQEARERAGERSKWNKGETGDRERRITTNRWKSYNSWNSHQIRRVRSSCCRRPNENQSFEPKKRDFSILAPSMFPLPWYLLSYWLIYSKHDIAWKSQALLISEGSWSYSIWVKLEIWELEKGDKPLGCDFCLSFGKTILKKI